MTARKRSATVQAGSGAGNPEHPGKLTLTLGTAVEESTTQSTPDQRQSMTRPLTWNSQITTCFAPLYSMGRNPSARAEICQQMGQLMAQGSIDFSRPEFLQGWIKQNEAALEISTTDGGAHAIVPAHL